MADERRREEPIDLSPLDPTADPRFEAIVSSIAERAARELGRRRERPDAAGAGAIMEGRVRAEAGVIAEIGRWWRPSLAAAAVLAIASAVLLIAGRGSVDDDARETGIAEAVGVPRELAYWTRAGEFPGPGELVVGLQEVDE